MRKGKFTNRSASEQQCFWLTDPLHFRTTKELRKEVDLQLIAKAGEAPRSQTAQIKEQEFLRKREEFRQQPIADERPGRIRKHSLVALESDRLDARPKTAPPDRSRGSGALAQLISSVFVEDQLIE